MRSLFIFATLLFVSISVFAQEPIVSYNVLVQQNATPQQCKDWRGQIDPEQGRQAFTSYGQFNVMGPGVRTCTGCSVNSNGNCTCKTCYDYAQ